MKARLPLWLLSGLLYGLSWPIYEGINLSCLAWVAFVPLFVFLEKNNTKFWKSLLGAYAAMVVFGCFSASWLFCFPEGKWRIALVFLAEEWWAALPFLAFFFLQKKFGFDRALWLLPFIWMLWEWVYLDLEFTMGTHLSAYSQSSNLRLIQFIDITGMWGVSFWLMLFNVLIYKALKSVQFDIRNRVLYKKLVRVAALMLGLPLIYGFYAYSHYGNLSGQSLRVSLIPTQYSAPFLLNPNNSVKVVEETLRRTDSLAFNLADRGQISDLYLWPETGMSYQLTYTNLGPLLFEAVKDWESALITGCRGVPDTQNAEDKRNYVSGVLLSHKNEQVLFHHKTVLTPGQEFIPYHQLLAKMPGFPIPETDPNYFKKGTLAQPLPLTTRNNQHFNIGVSLCFEQWYPEYWAKLARNGADFMVHLAGEGWYGNIGFQSFMGNVTRMRCIETRRQAARCANVGLSCFVDQLGRSHHEIKQGTLALASATITKSSITSFYATHPDWFPLTGFVVFLGILGFGALSNNSPLFSNTLKFFS